MWIELEIIMYAYMRYTLGLIFFTRMHNWCRVSILDILSGKIMHRSHGMASVANHIMNNEIQRRKNM